MLVSLNTEIYHILYGCKCVCVFYNSLVVSRLVTLSSVVLVGLSLELQSTTASTAGELSPTTSRVEHL